MNDFEKEYYENPSFWDNEMLSDEVNMKRFENTARLIQGDVNSLLDVGCGNGVFVNYLNKLKPNLAVHGLDRSKNALQYVKTEKTQGDIVSIPFPDHSFDCVTCLEVLEHLPVETFRKAIQELTRVSRKYIIVSVPFDEVLEDSHNQCPSCKTIFNYELHLQSFGEDKFRNLFSAEKVKVREVVKDGLSMSLFGHSSYRRMFYKEQFKDWKSPICPICGFQESRKKENEIKPGAEVTAKQKILSFFSRIPKAVWPKEEKYYWIIGLFEKE